MKVIDVILGFQFSAHESFGSTVGSVSPERHEAIQGVQGQVLSAYDFCIDTLVCQFENERFLTISCGDDRVEWSVSDANPRLCSQATAGTRFCMPNGDLREWMLEEILDSLLGQQVRFSAGEQMLFLYSKHSPEYVFKFYREKSDGGQKYLTLNEW